MHKLLSLSVSSALVLLISSAAFAQVVPSQPSGGAAQIGTAVNIVAKGAKGNGIGVSVTASITSGSAALTATGASFVSTDIGKMISVPGAGITPTATSVAISGTAGQFTCTCTNVSVGSVLFISGTYGGTGSITGYSSPTTYYVSATNGTSTFTLTAGGATAIVTTAGTPSGLTYAFQSLPLVSTISGFTDSTHITLAANASTTVSAATETIFYGTDNATAISNAITTANVLGAAVYIPAVNNACYAYTAPLTITANTQFIGDYVSHNEAGGINVPLGSPPLTGSVLCPSSNGSDGIDITGESMQVDFNNVGMSFQTLYVGTGHGIYYSPPQSGNNYQGLSTSTWTNVQVIGHDGNHYAFYLINPIGNSFRNVDSVSGGGGFYLRGIGGHGNYGNMLFTLCGCQVTVGGSAHGWYLSSDTLAALNLMTFIVPSCITDSINGVYPTGNPPTSTQQDWYMPDANVKNINAMSGDFETNVFSPTTFYAGNDNYFGTLGNSSFMTAVPINSPDWGGSGIRIPAGTVKTWNDTTSSGTIPLLANISFPGDTMSASSATTATTLTNVFIPNANTGTNVSATQVFSLVTQGGIAGTNFVGSGGLNILRGTTQINQNNGSATTAIGNGSTTGSVSIGGPSNVVSIGGPMTLAPYTVSTLPTCSATYKGGMAYVTDATAPTYNAALVGSGTSIVPVFCNGTAWSSH